jgi:nitrogen fixation protein FixH
MSPAKAWPLAIVGVLVVTVAANVLLFAAANDPGASVVERDYYRRALDWDRTQAERARSAALGWRTGATFRGVAPGRAHLELILRDGAGAPVTGARVEVEGVHNLAADRPQRWVLEETTPGLYAADANVPLAGRWELDVTATRGADRFVSVLHAEAPGAGR